MIPSSGFAPGTVYVPVPAPLFGPLLEEVQDLAELQCVMRLLFVLHRQRGPLRFVTASSLAADVTLLRALRHVEPAGKPQEALQRALDAAVARGMFLRVAVGSRDRRDSVLLLNTPENQRAAEKIRTGETTLPGLQPVEPLDEAPPPSNIFTLYEENVGGITPLIAEELQDAEANYSAAWIRDAIQEAVHLNKRNWRYIAAILKRWAQEGRDSGADRRRSEGVSLASVLRRRRE